jgi:hypothetical protein
MGGHRFRKPSLCPTELRGLNNSEPIITEHSAFGPFPGPFQRFWSKVDIRSTDECWHWIGAKNNKGYGNFGYQGKIVIASRLAYILTFGEPPENHEVMHSCDTPACCNPRHLEIGSHSKNMQDCSTRGRIHRRPARFSDEELDLICAEHAAGISVKKILAPRLKIDTSQLFKLIRKHKAKHRPSIYEENDD